MELNEDGYINDFFDKINELSKPNRLNTPADSELDGEIGGENSQNTAVIGLILESLEQNPIDQASERETVIAQEGAEIANPNLQSGQSEYSDKDSDQSEASDY